MLPVLDENIDHKCCHGNKVTRKSKLRPLWEGVVHAVALQEEKEILTSPLIKVHYLTRWSGLSSQNKIQIQAAVVRGGALKN